MATKANLTIDQGSDFIQDIELTDLDGVPIDLTNFIGAAQIRKTHATESYKEFTVTTNSEGIVQLVLNSANSNAMSPGQYVWDCELTSLTNGVVTRIVEGIITLTPSVTR